MFETKTKQDIVDEIGGTFARKVAAGYSNATEIESRIREYLASQLHLAFDVVTEQVKVLGFKPKMTDAQFENFEKWVGVLPDDLRSNVCVVGAGNVGLTVSLMVCLIDYKVQILKRL